MDSLFARTSLPVVVCLCLALPSLTAQRQSSVRVVVAADINPRVVTHLRRQRTDPPSLTLVSEIRDSDTVTLSADFRESWGTTRRRDGTVIRP